MTEHITEHLTETRNTYIQPFPKETAIKGVEYDSPAHVGPYVGAIDYLMDPGVSVLAPFDGVVIGIVQEHDQFGPTQEFEPFLNYITLKHPNGEFSQVAHLEKGSARVRIGQSVRAGQEIALTGNSGWQTEPHLHFFVFEILEQGQSFQGLRLRFTEE